MQNIRAYGARISGLLFFLISIGIVGLLVYLTVQSANRSKEEASVTDQNQTSQTEFSYDTASQPNQDVAANIVDQTASDDEGRVTDQAASTTAATTPPTNIPSTTIVATGPVNAAVTGEPLPNTGPAESAILTALLISLVVASITSYNKSKQLLLASIKKPN